MVLEQRLRSSTVQDASCSAAGRESRPGHPVPWPGVSTAEEMVSLEQAGLVNEAYTGAFRLRGFGTGWASGGGINGQTQGHCCSGRELHVDVLCVNHVVKQV